MEWTDDMKRAAMADAATVYKQSVRIEALQSALVKIAERRVPHSDTHDWAEVDFAQDVLTNLGIPYSPKDEPAER